MSKVYLIRESDDGYDNRIIGACSTEEKAKAVLAVYEKMNGTMDSYSIVEEEVDSILDNCVSQLEEIIEEYLGYESLLDRCKRLQ